MADRITINSNQNPWVTNHDNKHEDRPTYIVQNGVRYIQATAEIIQSQDAIKNIHFEINSVVSVVEYFIKFGVAKYNSSFFSRLM